MRRQLTDDGLVGVGISVVGQGDPVVATGEFQIECFAVTPKVVNLLVMFVL